MPVAETSKDIGGGNFNIKLAKCFIPFKHSTIRCTEAKESE